MGDDTEAVILEVPKAISTALDELPLAVEALGDAVVLCEAPHADDLLPLGGENSSPSGSYSLGHFSSPTTQRSQESKI